MSAEEIITEEIELNADCLALSEDEIKDCRTLKVAELTNLFWTNGSREKPLNVPPDNLFKELNDIKIDWITGLLGKIKLCGEYNYAIHRGGYYFMSKVRPVDIDKKIYVYSLIKDLWMSNYISGNEIKVKGVLNCTNEEIIIQQNLHLTKSMVSAPNSIKYLGLGDASAGCVADSTAMKNVELHLEGSRVLTWTQSVIAISAYKDFLDQLRAAPERPTKNAMPTIVAKLKISHISHWKSKILTKVQKFLAANAKNLVMAEVGNFTNIGSPLLSLALKKRLKVDKLMCIRASNVLPIISASPTPEKQVTRIDLSGCDQIIQLDAKTGVDKQPTRKSTNLYNVATGASVKGPLKYVFGSKDGDPDHASGVSSPTENEDTVNIVFPSKTPEKMNSRLVYSNPRMWTIYQWLLNAQNAKRPFSEGIKELKFVVGLQSQKKPSDTEYARLKACVPSGSTQTWNSVKACFEKSEFGKKLYESVLAKPYYSDIQHASNFPYSWQMGELITTKADVEIKPLAIYFANKTHGFYTTQANAQSPASGALTPPLINDGFVVVITEDSMDNKADPTANIERLNFEAGKVGYGIRYWDTYNIPTKNKTPSTPVAPFAGSEKWEVWESQWTSNPDIRTYSMLERAKFLQNPVPAKIRGATTDNRHVITDKDKGFYIFTYNPSDNSRGNVDFVVSASNQFTDDEHIIHWGTSDHFHTAPVKSRTPEDWWPTKNGWQLKPYLTIARQYKWDEYGVGSDIETGPFSYIGKQRMCGFQFCFRVADLIDCDNYSNTIYPFLLKANTANKGYYHLTIRQYRFEASGVPNSPWYNHIKSVYGNNAKFQRMPFDSWAPQYGLRDVSVVRAVQDKIGFNTKTDIIKALSYCSTTTLNADWLRRYSTTLNIYNNSDSIGMADKFLSDVGQKYLTGDYAYNTKDGAYYSLEPNFETMATAPLFFLLSGTNYIAVVLETASRGVEVELILRNNDLIINRRCETLNIANNDSSHDIVQAINQQNTLYVYGVSIPMLSKFKLDGRDLELQEFSLKEMTCSGTDCQIKPVSPFNYYRLYLKHSQDLIDQIITKMKGHQITIMKDIYQYESLKLEHMAFDRKKHYDVMAYNEVQRKTLTSLDIAKEKYAYDSGTGYQYKTMENMATGIGGLIGGLASVAGGAALATTGLNPLGGAKLMGYGSAAIVGGITRGFGGQSQLEHNVGIAGKTLDNNERAAAADLFIANMTMSNAHNLQSMNLRNEIAKFNANIHMGNINDWDIEKQYINELGTNMAVHIKHLYPTGGMYTMLKSYFNRYGADIFLDNYTFDLSELKDTLEDGFKRIIRFEIIDELNIPSVKIRSVIKEMFMNGVMIINNKF